MKDITIAIAQTIPSRQNIQSNLADHLSFIKKAAKYNADMIVFPEMSLTGYERELAEEQAFCENDPRFIELRNISIKENINKYV